MPREYVIRRAAPSGPKIDFSKELNPQQFAAVTAAPGPALVLAGAGSGKTRTLTYRVAYLVENGISPSKILLLTFTNKAAREMLDRVASLVPHDLSELWGGTFHSVGNRILRRHFVEAGFPEGFTVIDREDAEELLQTILLEMEGGGKVVDLPLKPSLVMDVLGYAANVLKPVKTVLSERYPQIEEYCALLEAAEAKYKERKQQINVMDFDDLLLRTVLLFEQSPEIALIYQRHFQFILVDEYQDTNPLQSRFIDILSKEHRNLMAVGDDAQAIYSWRGADHRNILSFSERYPGASIYKVENNYRSTPEILQVANSTLQTLERAYEKKLVSVKSNGEPPKLVPLQSGNQQAKFVVSRMLELSETGVSWNEMAVLYRAHFHSMELQMELTRAGIPFRITSGLRFFEQAHIKDVAAFMKFAVNPRDELAFKRMVKLLPGIGARSAESLWNQVRPLAEQAASRSGEGGASLGGQLLKLKAPAKAAAAWRQLGHTIEELHATGKPAPPIRMLRSIREAIYDDYARSKFSDFDSRREDLNTLAQFASQYEEPSEFLDQLALMGGADAEVAVADGNEECVTLSSVHQAKGLEWKTVFLIWLTEGMFPSQRSMGSLDAMEEERRLFYVAVTRAEEDLYLLWPLIRRNAGSGDTMQRVSPFLQAIPAAFLEEWQIAGEW